MQKFILSILLVAVVAASAHELLHERCEGLFQVFISKHRKGFGYLDDAEHSKRRGIFCENMKEADKLNEVNGSPVFGVTKYSDQTQEENAVLFGRKGKAHTPTVEVAVTEPTKNLKDASVDWTAAGRVTPVKNQGQCGSCWAHSVVEQIESEWIANGNSMWEFSVQQVNSCVKKCFGCGGGDTPAGYEYLMGLPKGEGLGSGAWGPYIQSMTEQCTGKSCTEACKDLDIDVLKTKASLTGYYAQVTGYTYATDPCASGSCASQNLTKLASNIAESGPASICVNAAKWTSYTGGVLTADACGGFAANDLDHCVQLTGYDSDKGYWIVRNSWSTDWGEDGYIYLQMSENTCGLANEATFVQLASSDSQKPNGGGM